MYVYCDHHNVAVTKKGTQRLKNSRKEIYCDLDRYFVIIFEWCKRQEMMIETGI